MEDIRMSSNMSSSKTSSKTKDALNKSKDAKKDINPQTHNPQLDHRKGPRKKILRGIYSKESVRKLANLGFDPIEKLVKLYYDVEDQINQMVDKRVNPTYELNAEGKPVNNHKTKYSSVAHAQLLMVKEKVIADLLPYAYTKLPQDINLNTPPSTPFIVQLSTNQTFDTLTKEVGTVYDNDSDTPGSEGNLLDVNRSSDDQESIEDYTDMMPLEEIPEGALLVDPVKDHIIDRELADRVNPGSIKLSL